MGINEIFGSVLGLFVSLSGGESHPDIRPERLEKIQHQCQTCHGVDGKGHTLGLYLDISGHSPRTLREVLLKYKNDKYYGGQKRHVMQAQAKKLTNEEIAAIAKQPR